MGRSRLSGFLALLGLLAAASPALGAEAAAQPDPAPSLRELLVLGIERNLGLRAEEVNVPIRREGVVEAEAAFDPEVEASADTGVEKTPTASAFTQDPSDFRRTTGADAGISKRFLTGLETSLGFETFRRSTNSSVEALDPQYRSFLVLDLTQPLLRDRGAGVNSADIRVSENQVRQASLGYLDQVQTLAARIERAYLDLALSHRTLEYRVESRRLAQELLQANRRRFEAGVVPISEVQEAETAVARRDEEVLLARQRVETVSNVLKDLLEIRAGDSLHGRTIAAGEIPGVDQEYPAREQALETALAERPDLKAQLVEIENRDIRLAYRRNQRLPRLDLEGTLGLNGLSGEGRDVSLSGAGGGTTPHEGDYFDSLGRLPDGDGYEWYAGIRFRYPLGNRAATARYRRAAAEKRQAVYRLGRLEGAVETDVNNALVDVERSRERVEVARRFERLAETTLSQEMRRLKEGLSDTFRVLDFQDSLIDARIREVTAVVDFNRGLADLYRAMGTNLRRHGIVAGVAGEETDRERM